MRRPSVLALVPLVVAGVLIPTSAQAAAPQAISCGATITSDAYLARDLTCATGVHVEGAVTIDLRGHRLTGTGTGVAISVGDLARVTVVDGTVRRWDVGIEGLGLDGGASDRASITVTGVALLANGTGITTGYADVAVSGGRLDDNGVGLSGFYGNAVVAGTSFSRNQGAVNAALGQMSFTDTRFTGNGFVASCAEALCDVRRSTLTGNGNGIVGFASGVVLLDSTARDNQGVVVDTEQDTITPGAPLVTQVGRNLFVGNETGVRTGVIWASQHVFDNRFVGNATGVRGSDDPETVFAALVEGNTFLRNGDAVVYPVGDPVAPGYAGVQLRGNTASSNTGWGIYAPGATDLGGNRARANGNQPQCTGVAC